MNGVGVSKGRCCAKAFVCREDEIILTNAPKSAEEEERDLLKAIDDVYAQNQLIIEKTHREIGTDAAAIFEAHGAIITDENLLSQATEAIKSGISAVCAVEDVMNAYVRMFETMDNEYLAGRAADIKDIKLRLQRRLLGIEDFNLTALTEPVVIVGTDITPSMAATMDIKHVAGFVTEVGGETSHTAILARTLEIPAVVGVKALMQSVKTGQLIALDGSTGEVCIEPSQEWMQELAVSQAAEKSRKALLAHFIDRETVTADGVKVSILCNIGTPEEADRVVAGGGEGIGLFRSEFLFLRDTQIPSEDEQFAAYKAVLEKMQAKPVIVRTLDIGGDKDVPALNMQREENPFLGLRAIRLCFARPEIFKTQLRALVRASVYGDLHIMLPMITRLEELRYTKTLLEECKNELGVTKHIPVGIMVEVPAVALMADVFAAECDFFSIGTNDLTQYTLAADRGNKSVADLYSACHPAVLRLLKNIIAEGARAGIACGMCGEAAGDIKMIPFLLGIGLNEFSVSPGMVTDARALIARLDMSVCQELAKTVMELTTTTEIEEKLNGFVRALIDA